MLSTFQSVIRRYLNIIFIFSILFFLSAKVANAQNNFYKTLTPLNVADWSFETSGTAESIVKSSDAWIFTAGGVSASTHYARIKYKIPEKAGRVLTSFYMKAAIVLPDDFYSKQNAGFRIMNTDNIKTTLNGVSVGSTTADEQRTSVYINSDHSLRVMSNYENHQSKELWRSQMPLPVGEHTIEFYGNVATISPWYLKIDGITVATGNEMLTTSDVPVAERVITRLVAGIDGAAAQTSNPMSLTIKSFEIADYDLNGLNTPSPAPLAFNVADQEPDGDVDYVDFNSFISNFGLSGIVGWIRSDIINDGAVNIFDFNKLISNFGL